jgi:hypothetical protein
MKKIIFVLAGLLFFTLNAQSQVLIGFKISPNVNLDPVKDKDPTPSGVNYVSDGYTQREANLGGIGAGVNFDMPLSGPWYFGTGLWFTTKNFNIRNTDAFYSGVSKYKTLYAQIPFLAKYRTKEIFNKFNLVFSGGGILDLKIAEGIDGADGAHYWNLAKQRSYIDPARGHNGDNRSKALFTPVNIGLYISAGAEYQLLDKISVFAGFSVNPSFLNMINPSLKFDDAAKTPVRQDVRFSSTIISFDMGIYLKGRNK